MLMFVENKEHSHTGFHKITDIQYQIRHTEGKRLCERSRNDNIMVHLYL